MKKIFSILLTLALLCLCSCSSVQKTEDFDVIETPQVNPNEQTDVDIEQSTPDGTVVSSYNPENLQNVKFYYNESNGLVINTMPQTLDELLKAVDTSGLIVSGFAYGERESVVDGLFFGTKTLFEIDHVFYGDASPGDTVVITEGYILKTNGDETYVYSLIRDHSYLQNGDYVLMFLEATPERGGYAAAHLPLPVAEDCDEWSEEYLSGLLDYFRGDRSTYKYPEDTIVTNDLGKPSLMEAPDWPQRDLSDEELIEEMHDNLLIYLATELKVKIWPTAHVNYIGTYSPFPTCIIKWQYPENQAAKYTY